MKKMFYMRNEDTMNWWLKFVGMTVAICFAIVAATMHFVDAAALANGQEMNLWPGAAPGSEKVSFHTKLTERSQDPQVHDRILEHIDVPTLTAYVPEKPNGTAIIVGPGGGYGRVCVDKESYEVADWLAPYGVTVFVLHYRLPSDPHENHLDVSLEDGQRAVRVVRAHAAEWGIDPARIGIMGFSAGGHMASITSTCYDRQVYHPVDAADQVSARPDFTILGYPVISMLPEYCHEGTKKRMMGLDAPKKTAEKYSSELQVTGSTPPAFIVCAEDDNVVPPINSIRYWQALQKHGIAAELHIYTEGGHGFGLGHKLTAHTNDWQHDCEGWLRDRGLI